jgi:hypothetical protein
MKRFWALGVVVSLGVALAFVAGCDDEDKGTGPAQIDPADSTFLTDFFGGAEIILGTQFQSMFLTLALLDSIPDAASSAGQAGPPALQSQELGVVITSVIDYDYDNGWHIFDFEAIFLDDYGTDTTDVAGTDSFQVVIDSKPVQFPQDPLGIGELDIRAHAEWSQRSAPDSGDAHHAINIVADTLGGETVVDVNGAVHDTLFVTPDYEGYCEVNVILDQAIAEVRLIPEIQSFCPFGGVITSVTGLDVLCVDMPEEPDTLRVDGTWTVTATFSDDNMITVTFSDGTVSWTITGPCEES